MTVRRDLNALEERGIVQRVRGGVIPVQSGFEQPTPDTPLAATRRVSAAPSSSGRHVGVLVPDLGQYHGLDGQRDSESHASILSPPGIGYYFGAVLAGVREGLEAAGIRPRLVFSRGRVRQGTPASDAVLWAEERRTVENLLASGIEGLLFTPIGIDGSTDDYLQWLHSVPVPVVLMERGVESEVSAPTVSSVRSAHESGVAMALTHLHEYGHSQIGLIVHFQSQTAHAVERGWNQACAALRIDSSSVVRLSEHPQWPSDNAVDAVLDGFMARGITAIMCHNDNNTFAVLHRLQARGVRIPEDISLVSYDDDFAGLFDPPVTAVAPAREFVGRLAASLLRDSIEASSTSVSHIRVEPRLVVRNSVAAARAAE